MTNFGCWWWWLLLGGLLGWLASWWLGRGTTVTVDRTVDRPVDRVVERIVEKQVDNPAHLSPIQALEGEVALMAGLRATISQLQADAAKPHEIMAGPTVAPLAAAATAPLPVPVAAPTPVPLPVPMPTSVQAQAPVRPPSKIMDRALERVVDLPAAGAAGYSVRGMDDLEIVQGIGPKIAALFKAEGIRMLAELAQTPQSRMQEILDRGGASFRLADPSNWARQASFAAKNQWADLRQLQDQLAAGVDNNHTGDL